MSAEATAHRWWIQPPMPDESLRSVLSRVAALYECSPKQLWESLNQDDRRSPGDVDSPSCFGLRRMAAAIGMPAAELLPHRQPDAAWLLAPHARNVFCPTCWNEARARGEPFSIRRDWNRVLRTRCRNHGSLLQLAPANWATWSPSQPFQSPAYTLQEQQILELIGSFEEALEQSLYFGSPWPGNLRGNPQIARQLLLAVSFNLNELRDFPLTSQIQVRGNLIGFIRGPLHQQDPVKKLRWDAFRDLSDPAIRRAGLWVAGWTLTPECPGELSPGILDLLGHVGARDCSN
ncbi:TniQ family protein [Luteimonas fraxinea]|uniref:TniQ family protein n=2 Tax=Luteimonas fraxinea TaxID=2901869 RepID=UPI003CCD33AA